MYTDLEQLIAEHHAFYEVSAHYVLTENRSNGNRTATQKVHVGFDVYGSRPHVESAPSAEYAMGYAALRKIADDVRGSASDGCSIEVIPFASTVILDARNHLQAVAMLRIHISHYRGVDKPADLPEQTALKEVENQLRSLGIPRR
jgi:hypothetical protein